jgi:hypothetical protein
VAHRDVSGGENWREAAREEDNQQLNGSFRIGTFAVAGGGECHFIRLVNIGRKHSRTDNLALSAWEIFGSLIEETADSSDVALFSASVDGARPPQRNRTKGTHADSVIPSCRRRFQLLLDPWGVTGASVPILQSQRRSLLDLRIAPSVVAHQS